MLTFREQKNIQTQTRAQLRRIPVITPEYPHHNPANPRWKGLQHGELADAVVEGLEERNVTIKEEKWVVSRKNNTHLTGSLVISVPSKRAPRGMDYSLGLHHSNDMNHALKFAVGAKVFICENGMVSGDVALRRLHTRGLELKTVIDDGLTRFLSQLDNVASFIEQLKAMPISEEQRDKLLMEAGRQGLLPWSRIGKVDREFRRPRFREFNQRTGWGLYNAFTYVIQKSPAPEQLAGMRQFRNLLLPSAAA